ncbi:MAG: hypothetical protein H6744_13525 [Deltaproteobacteria bacterium]|nr:hypothetical protein [Deltaproteobacteria bacterium]
MSDDPLVRDLHDAVVRGPGVTDPALRAQIFARGAGAAESEGEGGTPLAPLVARYVDRVREQAHRVDDAELAALRAAGHGDDAIFEITVAAALGAGLSRLGRVRALLRPEGTP